MTERNPGQDGMGEAERLALLESYAPDTLLGDAELQSIVEFAGKLADTPIALVSLVEANRQIFLAREGLAASETPRDQSFCQHAMLLDHVMEVPDATLDARFAQNPLVTGPPNIRFYAGAPLIGEEGEALGALCVISPDPRPEGLSDLQREGLSVLANAVMRRMRDRRAHLARLESEAKFLAMSNAIPQMAWSTSPDGLVDYFNERWRQFTGVPVEEHYGEGWISALHPDDVGVALDAWNVAVQQGSPYEVEYRLRRHDGEWRWTLARGLPMLDDNGQVTAWFGTNTDVHERKTLEEDRDLLTRELSHRIKNIFSLVTSLLHIETKSNPEFAPVATSVSARIGALSRAHDYVRPGAHGAAGSRPSLQALLIELFSAYDAGDEARVMISGDDFTLREEAVTPLALLFHELATNAAKYGALSVGEGRVALTIADDGETVRFDWSELGGPNAAQGAEAATGFGNRLVKMAVEQQLKGRLDRRWDAGGLAVTVSVPRARLA